MTNTTLIHSVRGTIRVLLLAIPPAVLLLSGNGSASAIGAGASNTPQVFRSNCVSCHGTDLKGRMGDSTNLTKVGQRMSKAQIAAQIKQGGGGMPPFSGRLQEAQIEELAAWLSAKK